MALWQSSVEIMFAFTVYFRFLAVRESRFLLPDSPAGAPGVRCGTARRMGGAKRELLKRGRCCLWLGGVVSSECQSMCQERPYESSSQCHLKRNFCGVRTSWAVLCRTGGAYPVVIIRHHQLSVCWQTRCGDEHVKLWWWFRYLIYHWYFACCILDIIRYTRVKFTHDMFLVIMNKNEKWKTKTLISFHFIILKWQLLTFLKVLMMFVCFCSHLRIISFKEYSVPLLKLWFIPLSIYNQE